METSSQLAASLLPVGVRLGETAMVLALTALVYVLVPTALGWLCEMEVRLNWYVYKGSFDTWAHFNIKGVPDKPSRISELGQQIQYDATLEECREVKSGMPESHRRMRDQERSTDDMREALMRDNTVTRLQVEQERLATAVQQVEELLSQWGEICESYERR